jgi:hypothetical protein
LLKTLSVVWVLLCLGAVAPAADLPLVADGKLGATIILPKDAAPAERRAADELRSHLAQMSGVELPVIADDQPLPPHAILLGGKNRHLAGLGVTLDPTMLGEEGFVLRSVNDGAHLVVAGTGRRGTLYGATTLLEKLGVRWFTPSITRAPKRQTVMVPALDETQVPAFEYREPFIKEAQGKEWAARLRTNGHHAALDESTGGRLTYGAFCHTLDALVPQGLFTGHPEYFPVIKGKRTNGLVQRCLSNPDVLRLSIEEVRKWMRANPAATIFSVSQNDTINPCECDACRAIERKYGGQHSALYIWFANQIGEAIEQEFPDKLIDTLAYQFTEEPPAGVRPRKNVRVRLCPIACCEAHPYEACQSKSNVAFADRLAKWSKVTDELYIWHYNIQFHHYLVPFPDFRQFPDSLRLYRRSGVKGVMFQGSYSSAGGSDGEMRAYVMAHLLWNPNLDADVLVTEWMRGVYGDAAAKPMRQWFDRVHQAAAATDKHLHVHTHLNPDRGLPQQYFTPELIAEGVRLHDEAERLAAGDAVALKQLAKSRIWLRYVQIVKARTTGPELDQFVADMASAGITHTGEPWDLKQWQQEFRGRNK